MVKNAQTLLSVKTVAQIQNNVLLQSHTKSIKLTNTTMLRVKLL